MMHLACLMLLAATTSTTQTDPTTPGSIPNASLGASLRALPELTLPSIAQDLLSKHDSFQFGVGTGLMPQLGLETTAMQLQINAAGVQARLPFLLSGQWRLDVDGRRTGYGLHARAASSALYSRNNGVSSGGVQLDIDALWAHWRLYLTTSLASPWYLEGAGGIEAAQLSVYAAPNQPVTSYYTLPLKFAVSAGRGRLIPIEPRLRLQKLEQMWLAAGVLRAPLDAQVVRDILRTWWALRHELGYDARLQYTLRLLDAANLLADDVNQETLYSYGRIFMDSALTQRLQGQDSRMTLRFGPTWSTGANPAGLSATPITAILRLAHRQSTNFGLNRELRFEPMLQFALRRVDRMDNIANHSPANKALDYARLLIVAPVSFRHFFYDARYNPQGMLGLRGRMGLALDVASRMRPKQDSTNIMAGAGVDYTWFRNRASGITAGVDVDVGYAFGHLAYVVGAQLQLDWGRAQTFYAGPVDVVDPVP